MQTNRTVLKNFPNFSFLRNLLECLILIPSILLTVVPDSQFSFFAGPSCTYWITIKLRLITMNFIYIYIWQPHDVIFMVKFSPLYTLCLYVFRSKVLREVCWVLSQAQRLKAFFFPLPGLSHSLHSPVFAILPCLSLSLLSLSLRSPLHHFCCLVSLSLWAEANLRRILAWLKKKRFILALVQLKEALRYWSRTSLLQCDTQK